jgi:hypothetical protein
MIHRGEIVDKKIRQSGLKMQAVADKLKIARSTLYAWLGDPMLDFDSILDIGKIINYDFSNDFKEINTSKVVNEDQAQYKKTTLPDCLRERDEWKDKYITLLESHNLLLKGEIGKFLTQ